MACVRLMVGRKSTRECRTFATTTEGLLALLDWLTASRVTHVAMEATGVYWAPVWKILSEGEFGLVVANAAHIKQVPGRKTDMNDAMWIADLQACGLIKASFVPEENVQELRSLTRTRKQLVREQTRHVQRIEKTLEEANIKLGAVISDLMGVSGRRMIEAMIATGQARGLKAHGERNPHRLAAYRLAALAERTIKASPKALYDALHGRLREHHRFLLKVHLRQWDALDAAIREIDRQIAWQIERMDAEAADGQPPFRELIHSAKLGLGQHRAQRRNRRHEEITCSGQHDELPPHFERSPPVPDRIVRKGLVHLARALIGGLADDRVEPRRHGGTAARPHLAGDKAGVVCMAALDILELPLDRGLIANEHQSPAVRCRRLTRCHLRPERNAGAQNTVPLRFYSPPGASSRGYALRICAAYGHLCWNWSSP